MLPYLHMDCNSANKGQFDQRKLQRGATLNGFVNYSHTNGNEPT